MALVTARLNAAIDSALTGITHAQLHTGAPGGSGTSNAAAGVSRAAVTGVGGATASADSLTFSFTIPGAGGPYTHVSYWNASTSGTFFGDSALTPNETFGGAGTLNVTTTVTAT